MHCFYLYLNNFIWLPELQRLAISSWWNLLLEDGALRFEPTHREHWLVHLLFTRRYLLSCTFFRNFVRRIPRRVNNFLFSCRFSTERTIGERERAYDAMWAKIYHPRCFTKGFFHFDGLIINEQKSPRIFIFQNFEIDQKVYPQIFFFQLESISSSFSYLENFVVFFKIMIILILFVF